MIPDAVRAAVALVVLAALLLVGVASAVVLAVFFARFAVWLWDAT